jgi:hypothetical protein
MTNIATFVRYALGLLLAFGALNAFGGGHYGLSGAPGVPVEWLAGNPFENYFVPSVILFVVVGGTLAFAALAVLARFRVARRSACTDIAVNIPRDFLWMYPALLPAPLFVMMVSGLHDQAAVDRKRFSRLAVAFSAIAATLLTADYFIQLRVIQPAILKGELDGLAPLSQYNTRRLHRARGGRVLGNGSRLPVRCRCRVCARPTAPQRSMGVRHRIRGDRPGVRCAIDRVWLPGGVPV